MVSWLTWKQTMISSGKMHIMSFSYYSYRNKKKALCKNMYAQIGGCLEIEI